MYRTHNCGELRKSDIGSPVMLAGWVHVRRDLGGVIFIDLRDREGLTQVVFRPEENPELTKQAHQLGYEDVIQVEGKVAARAPGMANPRMPTGDIEIVPEKLIVLNRADVLPFPVADGEPANEDLRLNYRYVDLRRPQMSRNLRLRHRVTKAVRDFLDENGFVEIETPILSKSTPEGARDFLVPSRIMKGKFYALPQAPQQYKQLLMVGGVEKYFQIAKCFRDEDLRSDRQPEFTQIDIEASFVTPEDVYSLVEGLLAALFRAGRGVEIATPFPRMTHAQAMDEFGSDKPDRRFAMHLVDLAEVFRNSSFKMFRGTLDSGGAVRAINAKGFASLTTGQSDDLTEMAKHYGAKGLAMIKVENGEWKSPLVKFFSEAEKEALRSKLLIEEGDLILFVADKWDVACEVLGRIRLRIAEMQKLTANLDQFDFLWVTDFPLMQFDPAEKKWNAVHHPFTRPKAEDVGKLEAGDFGNVRAEAYDAVLNGVELGGGSIRIHEQDLQAKVFAALGVNEENQQTLFGHILRAFRLGAPPHGGIAFGLDRIVMMIAGEESIREVIAFPKNNRAIDLMSQSPSDVDDRQLRDLGIRLASDMKSD
ncbi:MAG TPA: aspartate--tRNA ligase [Chthoniobacterales bacterium]|nr:aspartate--tRNA ligase [Chthoniobacterales bacterium]